MAPLGPVTRHEHWVYNRGYQADDEGYEMIGYYWLDEMRHEYNSIEHVLRCAVAKALGIER